VWQVIETSLSAFLFGFFHENMGAGYEEHGKRFHRDISQIAKMYSGKGVQICWLSTAGVL